MPWTFATKTETVSCNNQTYCSKYWHHPLDHQPCRLTTVNTDTIRCTISLVALLQQILAPSIGTVEPVFAKAGGIQQILAPSAVPPALVNTGTIHCTTSLTAANTGTICRTTSLSKYWHHSLYYQPYCSKYWLHPLSCKDKHC